MTELESSLQYEAALTVANFCLWIASELKQGHELPGLTSTLPKEWSLAATALHQENEHARFGRRSRLRRETA